MSPAVSTLGSCSWTSAPGRRAGRKIWVWRAPVCPFLCLSGRNPVVRAGREQGTDHLWVGLLRLCALAG
uniref:Uncharacterized protein n=1 Tax=Ficedula albicollis TaxID=59894 RepID=A0A803VTC1_FICAL